MRAPKTRLLPLPTVLLLFAAACSRSPAPSTPATPPSTLATIGPAASSPRPLVPTATGGGPGAAGASATARTGVYIVKAGDTLFAIASAQGVPLPALMAANPTVAPENLLIGQQLIIPTVTPAAGAATATRTSGSTTPVIASATPSP